MAVINNEPTVQQVLNRIASLPASLLAPYEQGAGSYPLLEELLARSIAWVEDEATTAFNCRFLPIEPEGISVQTEGGGDVVIEGEEELEGFFTLEDGTQVGYETHDGNTTNQLVLHKRPVLHVAQFQLVTPILGYVRVYKQNELKVYMREGVVKIWTYKLATEQALMQTIDYQAWGSLLPPLPQAAQVAYCYGFALYDPECTKVTGPKKEPLADGPATSLDGGHTWRPGDRRDPTLSTWLSELQEAAICNTALMFLSQAVGLARGLASSVSFDGYSRGLAQTPFAAEAAALQARRDELLNRRRRRFSMATIV